MTSFKQRRRLILTALAYLVVSASDAATVNINLLGKGQEKVLDQRYNDGESILLRTTSGTQSFTLSATNYGEDGQSAVRWGLVDASKPWNRGKEGALLQQGFAPTAVGSTSHSFLDAKGARAEMDASYLSVIINKSSATMFTNVRVDLAASSLALSPLSWAGTSANNFSTATNTIRGPLNSQGRGASWDFTNLNYAGDGPLELRFYGVLGGDSALLTNFSLQIGSVPIPEGGSLLLLAGTGFWLGLLRRHR